MRLISQDGYIDVLYEINDLMMYEALGKKDEIIYKINCGKYNVARYSTEEKALKVMEMVRNAYAECMTSKCFFAGMMSVIAKFDETTSKAIEKTAKEAYIFQFPKDEDVEV